MKINKKPWFIYSLADPRTLAVRYIGWAYSIKRRLAQHIARAKKETTHKANWLNQLASLGLTPIASELESGSGDWANAERRWIAHHREQGADLTNATEGGEGVVGLVFSEDSRDKMSRAKKGKRLSAEHVRKVADAIRGRNQSPECIAKISASKVGRKRSPETIQKMSKARTGVFHTEETKQKMSESRKGKKHSPEAITKMRAAKMGRKLSDEHRRKLSEAKKGRKLSDAHKEAIRTASGGWNHTPEAIEKIREARKQH